MITKLLMLNFLFQTLSLYTKAQEEGSGDHYLKLSALYGGIGFGLGRRFTPAGLGANIILSNNWGAGIGYKRRTFKAEDLPGNYSPGLTLIFDGIPNDYFDIISFAFSREFPTSSKNIRFGIEAGPAWVKYRKADFTKNSNSSGGWFGLASNYDVNYSMQEAISLSFRIKLEFPVSRALGYELAVSGNVNKFKPFMGFEIFLNIGKLRD